MTLDLSYEQVFNSGELLQGLQICQQELNELEDKGLSFIEIGDDHYYLGSTLLAFLKGIEGKDKGMGEIEAPEASCEVMGKQEGGETGI